MNEIERLILEGLLIDKGNASDENIEREDKWIKKVENLLKEIEK